MAVKGARESHVSYLPLERLPSRPIINKELSNLTVVQGSEVELTCSVISDLVPYITWLKHSTRYNGVDDEGNIIDRLFIVKVTPRTCVGKVLVAVVVKVVVVVLVVLVVVWVFVVVVALVVVVVVVG